ncbi:MAG: enoyl-CoA hydratase-related protein [Chloroflexi bacterium]|nr:enoyl-CoA hydratase-related protein [Chloroflexota bacterium]
MQFNDITYQTKDHVAIITFNRPEVMNALTLHTHDELHAAIEKANQDKDVRVLVITGNGKGFCSGDDVKKMFEANAMERGGDVLIRQLQGEPLIGGAHQLLTINKPSIAAVNGAAVGYGCDIALMCSMRIASDRARFGEVFLRMGIIPDESLIVLPRLVGLAKAYELLLTTDIIDAKEAERIGLVNKVVPHDELMKYTMELAGKIVSKPPIAVQLAMEGIRRGLGWPMEAYMQYAALAFTLCLETEDHKEGYRAFIEKREPEFQGK